MNNDSSLGPFLKNSFNDRYLYEVNGFTFNKVGSAAQYRQHFKEGLFEEYSLYLILGTDSGLLPQYISKEGLPKGSYYLFVEIPEILERLNEVVPVEDLDERIILSTSDQWLTLAKKLNFQNFVYLDNFKFIPSFAAIDGRLNQYVQLKADLQEELEKLTWGLKVDLGAELFHIRQLQNLPENRVSADCLNHLFSGRTAIVLAGGPSLDEILPWVVENRNRLLVIAVSRISRRLLEMKITPDIVVSIDPNYFSFDISKELLEFWEKTVFVNKFHVVNTLLGQWSGRNFYVGTRVPWDSPLNENVVNTSGPTVTNTAIDLALKMGVTQLFLGGVDLCHSRDGYTHAKGSNERGAGPQLGKGQLWVETNGSWMAETTPDFHFSAMQIGFQAEEAKSLGCRFISLAEGATKIENIDYKPPKDIDLPEYVESPQQILASLPNETAVERIEFYQRALLEMSRAQKALREIKRLAVAGLKANAAFCGKKGGRGGDPRQKAKMDRVEKKLKNNFPDFNVLVKKFGIRDFLKLTQIGEEQDLDWDDVERLGRVYYEAYRDSSDRLLKIVREAEGRLKSRLEEEEDQPDFQLIIKQWQLDQQPGRSLVWKKKHPQHVIPNEFVDQFDKLENEFREIFLLRETGHMRRVRSLSDLSQVRGKLLNMFNHKQVEKLETLVGNLGQNDSEQARALFCLGSGYLAELDKKFDKALAEYQKIFDLQTSDQDLLILEDSLRRVLSLSLRKEDYGSAEAAAECLSGISVIYLPYHAELLWALGKKQTSLDLYANYLEQVPTDYAVMIKVGRHYWELNFLDGARLMFETVLTKDANNVAARTLLDEMKKM